MKQTFLLATLALSAFLGSCAPFPVPSDWPVKQKVEMTKVRTLEDRVGTHQENAVLTRQERALLTFLSDNVRINEAIGQSDRYGTKTWKIAEIFLIEPGRKVSVLCEEGHFQEPLYFRYNPENSVWYRVDNFENPKAIAVPALIVQR
jgi:hypothetical protein